MVAKLVDLSPAYHDKDKRRRVLKKTAALRELPLDSEDIFQQGVWSKHLDRPVGTAAQGFALSPTIKAESLLLPLSSRLPSIEALLLDLLTALYPDTDNDPQAETTLVGLQAKVWELLAKSARESASKNKEQKAAIALLKVMNQICSLLDDKQFEPPHSEHVFVSAWSNIINALFQGSFVHVIL